MMNVRLDFMTALVVLLSFGALMILLRRASGSVSWIKFVVFLILAWFILEPSMAVSPPADSKPSLAVLLDVSRSMGIEDPEPRLSGAQHLLARVRSGLEERFKVSYYQFSESASRVGFDSLMKAKPDGARTDIANSVEQVLYERKHDRPAVLVLSDGTKTAAAQKEGSIDFLSPIFGVGLGNEEALTDLAVAETRVSDFAFKGRPVELSVVVRNYGFHQKRLPVILREISGRSERDVQIKEVRFAHQSGESEILFKFTPGSVGRQKYRVQIPVQKDEIAKLNNALDFDLEVGREKLRILYLCGAPSPEYSFLRQVLKSDPSVDLVSFVILRNPENIVPVPEDQLSLIPFPANDIFVRTLPEFDLLIFENFSYARFGILPSHLENIRQFVEEKGGAFLMIGGENSFGSGNYANSPIDDILPVRLNVVEEGMENSPVALKWVDQNHPIYALGDTAGESQKIWQTFPVLNGYYKLPGIKKGASLLAAADDGGAPLIAAWKKGKGRVLAMGIFSTWQWALGLSEKGFLQSNYTQFWRQTVQWLTSLEDSKEIRMVLNQSQGAVGKPLTIQVFTRIRHNASGSRSVTLTVAQEGKPPEAILLESAGANEYRAQWIPAREGRFELAGELREGLKVHSVKRVISVQSADPEIENPYPDHAHLKDLSQKTGGEFYKLSEFSPEKLEGKIKPAHNAAAELAHKDLARSPWLLALAAGLLIFEWAYRRYRNEI